MNVAVYDGGQKSWTIILGPAHLRVHSDLSLRLSKSRQYGKTGRDRNKIIMIMHLRGYRKINTHGYVTLVNLPPQEIN
jgi:hypothetical protein